MIVLVLLLLAGAAQGADASLFGITLGDAKGGTAAVPVQITILLTLLALLPAAIMSVTPFLRISIVLHFLRQALGTQSAPSNQTLVGLSLFLTMLVTSPLLSQIHEEAWVPMQKGQLTQEQAIEQAGKPLSAFLLKYTREKDIRLFLEISHAPAPKSPQDLEFKILVPAYIISELKTGFQIGAVLFLPFLVIDIVVASVTLSIGMVQLPPVMISAPFKILLFVLVDGWNLLIGSLIKSFY
ncbi:MAG TPA: flagellar type III secretion system pore protein FliP [Bryobacteraceae bacterium]|nr:flagellar type III secretion system pore protein FliP [Bryobacteraceae bacterium]